MAREGPLLLLGLGEKSLPSLSLLLVYVLSDSIPAWLPVKTAPSAPSGACPPHHALTTRWQARANLGLKNQVVPKQRWQVLSEVWVAGLGLGRRKPLFYGAMPESTQLSRRAVLSHTPSQRGS